MGYGDDLQVPLVISVFQLDYMFSAPWVQIVQISHKINLHSTAPLIHTYLVCSQFWFEGEVFGGEVGLLYPN